MNPIANLKSPYREKERLMTNPLSTLAAYVPPEVVRNSLKQSKPALPTAPACRRMAAAVLFADVSGFTPLTESLARKGPEGAEEMTRLLNAYFSRMIALIEAEGGEVVKFSGDALMVIFPARRRRLGAAARRAFQAARAMQTAMAEFATLQTSAGPVALGMKIGIGAGDILTARIGGRLNRWEYIVAGDPLRQVAEAEHRAERGQIILSPETEAAITPRALPPRPLVQPNLAGTAHPDALRDVLQAYVPGAVTSRLSAGQADWLAELRRMSILFIGIGGLDYTRPNPIEQLQAFMHAAQDVIYRYEGSINKVAVDDKGTILIALFGAPPHSHEDDPARASRCALDLQEVAAGQGLRLAIGITTGRVFAGPVGGPTRREYTVMGDTVNLSARLMSAAAQARQSDEPGGIIRCDYETYRAARTALAFDTLPPVRVKGKAGLIRVYVPTGAAAKSADTKRGRLIGRRAETTRLSAALDAVQAGQSRVLLIEGAAGIGKSRLLDELKAMMHDRGIVGLMGYGRSIEQHTPYRAWRDIFTSFFDLEEIDDPERRQQQVIDAVNDVIPSLSERIPLLNDVLQLEGDRMAENDLTRSMDAELRHESLVSLLLVLLNTWAIERPLVLVLEDAHWLDSLSWKLALQVARGLSAARAPLLLVPIMRPLEDESQHPEHAALAAMPETGTLTLTALSPDETLALAASRLDVPLETLPPAVVELMQVQAAGNPFFAEELIYALVDSGALVVEDGRPRLTHDLADLNLPDTVQGIVLARIDRLAPAAQLTLKVAATIGRTFAYATLRDTLQHHTEIVDTLLQVYLSDLRKLDLEPLDMPEPELTYIFKHIITQEVAYQTLLYAQRRQLHQTVAQLYEETARRNLDADTPEKLDAALAPYYSLLVHHWHQAGNAERERHYLHLAGKQAAAQFANVEAADYLSRALALTPPDDIETRFDLLLLRESVNDLRGEREAQAADLAALTELVDSLADDRRGVQVALRQANYHETISDYPAALSAAQRAVTLAGQCGDEAGQIEGAIAWGRILWRQGEYDAARRQLERPLRLARAAGNRQAEAGSLYYLGQAYLYQNNYPAAQEHYQNALEIYRAIGHRQGEADSLNMLGGSHYELGNYSAARDSFEQVLAINRTIGDRRGETITLGNLGTVYCDLGDYETARDYHDRALSLRLSIGDRWGESVSLVNLGLVYHDLGDDQTARTFCERALAIQREIGDRSGEGYSLTYLGHTLEGLGLLDEARQTYNRALNLRRELGQHSLSIDDLAGLSRVALARNDLPQATQYAEEIIDWIETNGTEGIEYPAQVCLTCYHVLKTTANGHTGSLARANAILERAHRTLQQQAAAISDGTLRQKFLQNVRANREIINLYSDNFTN